MEITGERWLKIGYVRWSDKGRPSSNSGTLTGDDIDLLVVVAIVHHENLRGSLRGFYLLQFNTGSIRTPKFYQVDLFWWHTNKP